MLTIPTSWKHVSLKTFCELEQIHKDNSLDVNAKDIEILSLLSGKPRSEILSLPLKTRHEYLHKVEFLNDLDTIKPMRFSKKPLRFFIKGKRFCIALNAKELTGGQYIDLMTFLKEPEATNQNIHNVLAVLASPLKLGLFRTKYKGHEHSARATFFFENMPVSIAYPVLVFFCNLSAHLTTAMQDYLRTETMQKMNQMQARMQDIMTVTAG